MTGPSGTEANEPVAASWQFAADPDPDPQSNLDSRTSPGVESPPRQPSPPEEVQTADDEAANPNIGALVPVEVISRRAPQEESEAVSQSMPTVANEKRKRVGGRAWWRRPALIQSVLLPFLFAVIGGAAGSLGSLLLAPQQEARANRGVEQAENASDDKTPPIFIDSSSTYFDYSTNAVNIDEPASLRQAQEFLDSVSERRTSSDFTEFASIRCVPIGVWAPTPEDLTRTRFDVAFEIVGQHYSQVSIKDVTVSLVEPQEEAPDTSVILMSPEGASGASQMGFVLGEDDQRGRVIDDDGKLTSRPYFQENQITVERNERVKVNAIVYASHGLYRFNFVVTTNDGKVFTVNNGPEGQAFVISSLADGYQTSYALNQGVGIKECLWLRDCAQQAGYGLEVIPPSVR